MAALPCRLKAAGELVADTGRTGKPLVVITGRRPLTGGLSPGAEEALFSMKAGGNISCWFWSTSLFSQAVLHEAGRTIVWSIWLFPSCSP